MRKTEKHDRVNAEVEVPPTLTAIALHDEEWSVAMLIQKCVLCVLCVHPMGDNSTVVFTRLVPWIGIGPGNKWLEVMQRQMWKWCELDRV